MSNAANINAANAFTKSCINLVPINILLRVVLKTVKLWIQNTWKLSN